MYQWGDSVTGQILYFWGKFLKKLGRFLFWVIFYFFWAKNRKLIISGHIFTIGQHWFFKSVHLVIKTLYSMLEIFEKITQRTKFAQSPSPPKARNHPTASDPSPICSLTFPQVHYVISFKSLLMENFTLLTTRSIETDEDRTCSYGSITPEIYSSYWNLNARNIQCNHNSCKWQVWLDPYVDDRWVGNESNSSTHGAVLTSDPRIFSR